MKLPLMDEKFCEFYGILMGDGCVIKYFVKSENRYRYCVSVSGHADDDLEYFKRYLIPRIKYLFGLNPAILHYTGSNAIRFDIRIKELAEFLLSFGYPLGKKTRLIIPRKIASSGDKNVNMVIRGLFDTDGCIYARKDEGYKYPHVMITSYKKELLKQLASILRKQGFSPCIHKNDLIVRGKSNVDHWFEVIGSSHPKIIGRYRQWKTSGKLLPKSGLVV